MKYKKNARTEKPSWKILVILKKEYYLFMFYASLTLRLAPLEVFSMLMYLPSGQTSEMDRGPLAVLW